MKPISQFEVGFELELITRHYYTELPKVMRKAGIKALRSWTVFDYTSRGTYSITTDGSIEPNQKYVGREQYPPTKALAKLLIAEPIEIRSFVVPTSQLIQFKPLFIFLKNIGARTNKRCGLHIHLSHTQLGIDARNVMKLITKEQVRVKPSRSPWVDWDGRTGNPRYAAVNQRKWNHVEFRLFNAAIDFRYLCKMVQLCERYAQMDIDQKFIHTDYNSTPSSVGQLGLI